MTESVSADVSGTSWNLKEVAVQVIAKSGLEYMCVEESGLWMWVCWPWIRYKKTCVLKYSRCKFEIDASRDRNPVELVE